MKLAHLGLRSCNNVYAIARNAPTCAPKLKETNYLTFDTKSPHKFVEFAVGDVGANAGFIKLKSNKCNSLSTAHWCTEISNRTLLFTSINRTLTLNANHNHLQLHDFNIRRYYGSKVPEDKVKPPFRPHRYVLDKLSNFITASEDQLEKRLPRVFKVYITFRTGVAGFTSDTKEYRKVSSQLWKGESLEHFSRRQLEIYRQFSGDLPKVGLLFVIAFVPFGIYLFPLAYVFPRYMLSHHFWTDEQKVRFRRIEMTDKLKHYESILKNMTILNKRVGHHDRKDNMRTMLKKLAQCEPLAAGDILSKLPLFEGKPFKVDSLSIIHIHHLSKANGLSVRRNKLVKDALMLHYMDIAMRREGISKMDGQELDRACSWRGLNPDGLPMKEKVAYLENWSEISAHVHESSISLLLHLPVMLGYCQPTNRQLMPLKTSKQRGKV